MVKMVLRSRISQRILSTWIISCDSLTTTGNKLNAQVESEIKQCVLGVCKYSRAEVYIEPGAALYVQIQDSFQHLSILNSTPSWRKFFTLAFVKEGYLVLSISCKGYKLN